MMFFLFPAILYQPLHYSKKTLFGDNGIKREVRVGLKKYYKFLKFLLSNWKD